MNSLVLEHTLDLMLNRAIIISEISEVSLHLNTLYSYYYGDLRQILEWNLDDDEMKLTITKYGILDISSKVISPTTYTPVLRFYLCTQGAGPAFFENSPDINPECFMENWRLSFEQLLPLTFTILDACCSNSLSVWKEKYFYI